MGAKKLLLVRVGEGGQVVTAGKNGGVVVTTGEKSSIEVATAGENR